MAAASNFKQMMSCKKSLSISLTHTHKHSIQNFSLQPEAVIKYIIDQNKKRQRKHAQQVNEIFW